VEIRDIQITEHLGSVRVIEVTDNFGSAMTASSQSSRDQCPDLRVIIVNRESFC